MREEINYNFRPHLLPNDFADNATYLTIKKLSFFPLPAFSSFIIPIRYKKRTTETWHPIGIHEIMVFWGSNSVYPLSNETKIPKIADCECVLTVLIYLNDEYPVYFDFLFSSSVFFLVSFTVLKYFLINV